MVRADSLEKALMLGKIEGKRRRGQQLNGQEFEQTPGDVGKKENLACCSPWGHRVGHNLATEQLNNNNNKRRPFIAARETHCLVFLFAGPGK